MKLRKLFLFFFFEALIFEISKEILGLAIEVFLELGPFFLPLISVDGSKLIFLDFWEVSL